MLDHLLNLNVADILTIDDQRIHANELNVIRNSIYRTNCGQLIITEFQENYLICHEFNEQLCLSFCEIFDEFSSKNYKFTKQIKLAEKDKVKYFLNNGPCSTRKKVTFREYFGDDFYNIVLFKKDQDITIFRGFTIEPENVLI